MPEQLDLTTPLVKTVTAYQVAALLLDWASARIVVTLTGTDGATFAVEYVGPAASTLMTTLNSANLSVTSLYKRVLQKLVTDGKLPAGTVSGSPQ